MKKILITLFLLLILAFSFVGITNYSSKPGTDIEPQTIIPSVYNLSISKEIKREST